jgi:hypothetical protein
MAAPVVAARVAKKLIVDLISDPEKGVKNILLIIFVPILFFCLLFVVPVMVFTNVPLILFGGGSLGTANSALTPEQVQYVSLYQKAPITINQENLAWIESQKSKYSGYDDIVVKTNYTLTWQPVLAIDTARLKQDFSKCNEGEITDLARMFVDRFVTTETYQVQEPYSYSVTNADGSTSVMTGVRTVTKRRAVINIDTKPFNTVLSSLNLDSFDSETANNFLNSLTYMDVEGNANLYDEYLTDLKEYPPGNATIPYFNQADKRWGNSSYGNSTIASGGCGPTSLSMVVAGLTGRTDINPKVVADWSVANGYRAEGAGSYWGLMTAGGANYGLKVDTASRQDPNKIVQALSQGKPVIVAMGRGHFTSAGHFIVLRGVTKDGKILVNDPASFQRTQQEWDISIIMGESSTNGGVNGSPFWIFSK